MKKISKIKRRILLFILLILLSIYYFSLPRTLFRAPYSTVVESKEGRLLSARIAQDGQWRFPPVKKVPEKFKKALITYEDKRFFYHWGVDPVAMGRALFQNIKKKTVTSGGSTISMQVLRMSRGEKKRTIGNKLIESVLATRLEFRYSKESILALYASNAPFGGNVVGIEAASWRYFGRPAEELSWAEAATLAVLPNAPALIHISKNRDKLKVKRDNLLHKLHTKGIISDIELELALNENLPNKPLALPMFAYHLTDRISKEKGNIVAQTTLNLELQKRTSELAARKQEMYINNGINNLAILVSDVKTGKVIVYVGNVLKEGDKSLGSNVDIITSRRSSGSVFKPLLYAAMLDEGELLPDMLISDIPVSYGSFSPKNYTSTFNGAVPAHRVLERSLNVPSVTLLKNYGIEKFNNLLNKLGFSTITRSSDDYGLTLILGGAECTLWDLVNVYTKKKQKMNSVNDNTTRLTNLTFYENQSVVTESLKSFPYDLSSLWFTFQSLAKLNRPEEEGQWYSFSSSRRVAWKTGTSYGSRDAWSIGVTPEYVVGVWVGNASGEGRPALSGVGYAAPVMFDVFALLPKSTWFTMPAKEVTQSKICLKSGHLASHLCPETEQQWIPKAGLNTSLCPYHIEVNVTLDGKYRVNTDCESISNIKREVFFVLPPAEAWYYKSMNSDYRPLPSISPKCISTFGTSPLAIIYPRNDMSVVIPRKLEGEKNAVVFQAANTNPQALIFWHIDNEYVGTTSSPHQIAVNPKQGTHILTLVDSEGYSIKVKFNVED
jgi:penicillin-binding protein 1C